MIVIPYKAEHMEKLDGPSNWMAPYFTQEHAQALEGCDSYTGIVDGKIVACGGIVNLWNGRGEVWAILDCDCKKNFLSIHRKVMAFLESSNLPRIEACVDFNFDAAHRWVRLLGFNLETPHMPHYFPDGRDGSRYVRIR